jgi:hypothetical protein
MFLDIPAAWVEAGVEAEAEVKEKLRLRISVKRAFTTPLLLKP